MYTLEHRELQEGEFWREIPVFAKVSQNEFLDYKWQIKNSISDLIKLAETIKGVVSDDFIVAISKGFHFAPMNVRVTPYLLSLIDWNDPWNDPIRKQFIPVSTQLIEDHPMLTLDSLHEQKDAPVSGLTHRYIDKALFLTVNACPVYCRFCTRSYAIGADTETVKKVDLYLNSKHWENAFQYIESRPELEDVVISGGDTYNLSAEALKKIGFRLLQMPNIQRIRFATKGLAVMPMKILSDEKWLDALTEVFLLGRKLHKQVAIHTHFNNAKEITMISKRAMDKLFERGITIRNQSVLLRGVNDTYEKMQLLVKRLSYINVQPYYVFQHDMVKGVEDLRTCVKTAIEIEKNVRGVTAGFNTPTFVLDAPGGGGKRCIHSYEYYNRETGVSVYTAPSVKPGKYFMYFDPFHSLSEEIRQAWRDQKKRQQMCLDAIYHSGVGACSRLA
ncbi:KamA family radical SAM protein [Scytonema sp. PCC 10023]|uniref:KamA family radical SAM protein n=1 Tax=Scytonema sp. PCC 10023 TaxID=1680591 RepID=UPI0039C60AF2